MVVQKSGVKNVNPNSPVEDITNGWPDHCYYLTYIIGPRICVGNNALWII